MKIVFLDASTIGDVPNLIKLQNLGDYSSFDMTTSEQRIERIKDCQVVITNKVVIDKNVMDSCPQIKLICIAATGMNNIDLEYAAHKGIEVKNVSGYSTESVAQFTFSMLFHLLHHTAYYDNYVLSGEYIKSEIFTHHPRHFWELKNKRIGIIGMGSIGKRVAALAEGFWAEVVYYSTSGKNLNVGFLHMSLEDLLGTSDVVSVHCPLNKATENLIDEKHLRLMKPTAFLLNAGRGGIVNEAALAKAIDSQWIAGAAVDVLTKEPISQDNPLLSVKNKERILITPHIAWTSNEARQTLIEQIIFNIREFQMRQQIK